MIKNKKILYIGLFSAILVLVLDQLSKLLVLDLLRETGSINILSFFNLTMVFNRGISFGMLNGGSALELVVIALITTLIVGFLIRAIIKTDIKYRSICFGLVIGGALGNVIDRFIRVGVVDFLDFYIGKHHYPAFNVADSAICIGVSLLLLESLFIKEEKK